MSVLLTTFWEKMVCFTKLTPRTPPSVIHGWKATDLLFQMVKRKNYCRNPISRQNFANALAENPNQKLEVCRNVMLAQKSAKKAAAKVLKSYNLLRNVLSCHRVAKVLKMSSHINGWVRH